MPANTVWEQAIVERIGKNGRAGVFSSMAQARVGVFCGRAYVMLEVDRGAYPDDASRQALIPQLTAAIQDFFPGNKEVARICEKNFLVQPHDYITVRQVMETVNRKLARAA